VDLYSASRLRKTSNANYVFFAPRPGHTTEPITTHDGSYDVLSTKVVPFEGPR